MAEFEAVGCIHVHSSFSDGSGTIPDIVEAAEEAGLDFLILTDHKTVKARKQGLENWYGRTLLIVGEEVGGPKGHLLAVDVALAVRVSSTEPKDYVRQVQAQGGLSFMVHPDGRPKPQFGIADTRWKVRGDIGLTGLEIWSYMYDWIDKVQWWNLPFKFLKPNRALRGPHPATLRTWDTLAQRRRVVGYGGIDAHAKRILPGLKIFPYRRMFRSLRNHLLLRQPFSGNPSADKKQVLEALREGRCFFALDHLGDSSGFRFEAAHRGQTYTMGGAVELQSAMPVTFSGRCPQAARAILLCDGRPCFEGDASSWHHETQHPGVYRVELRHRERPWLFSNPISVRSPRTDGAT